MREKICLDKDWLREQYQVNGLSLRAIADIVGCSTYVIHSRMERFGIPRRNSWPKKDTLYTDRDWLHEMFVDNEMTITAMANLAPCSRRTIAKWLKEYVIECPNYPKEREEKGLANCECQWCGNKFHTWPTFIARGAGKFCSVKCYNEWRTKHRHKVICEQCGKEFAVAKARNRKFCSRKCFGLSYRERIEIECLVCGKKVEIRKKEVRSNSGKFCSKECFYKWELGENSAAWRGGKSFEPYSIDFNRVFKKKVRQRDLYKCAVCSNRALSVHHIDYNKQNTTFGNCITLCHSHHSKTNFNRRFWTTMLLPLATQRTEVMEGLNA